MRSEDAEHPGVASCDLEDGGIRDGVGEAGDGGVEMDPADLGWSSLEAAARRQQHAAEPR